MKIFTDTNNKNMIDTYYKNNGMYQTTIKYMKMFNESSCFLTYRIRNGISCENYVTARILLFHEKDMNDDQEISRVYHRFNDEYIRLPYNTNKDVALAVVDDSRFGEVSFIFHENGTGIYDEIRYVFRNVVIRNDEAIIDEI